MLEPGNVFASTNHREFIASIDLFSVETTVQVDGRGQPEAVYARLMAPVPDPIGARAASMVVAPFDYWRP